MRSHFAFPDLAPQARVHFLGKSGTADEQPGEWPSGQTLELPGEWGSL